VEGEEIDLPKEWTIRKRKKKRKKTYNSKKKAGDEADDSPNSLTRSSKLRVTRIRRLPVISIDDSDKSPVDTDVQENHTKIRSNESSKSGDKSANTENCTDLTERHIATRLLAISTRTRNTASQVEPLSTSREAFLSSGQDPTKQNSGILLKRTDAQSVPTPK
jgi:hypothetical protein